MPASVRRKHSDRSSTSRTFTQWYWRKAIFRWTFSICTSTGTSLRRSSSTRSTSLLDEVTSSMGSMRAAHESDTGTPVTEDGAPDEPYPRPLYAWYVVGVLTLAYVFSYMDRQILSLLVEPIRRDLGISDTQMSLLMGLSFAVFYTFFGIPLGRLVDSRSRRGIIAAGFALWSLFTAACGIARTYTHLLLLRMGVGVGEAALSPAAYSLISDYMPPQRRNLA